jgi:transposase
MTQKEKNRSLKKHGAFNRRAAKIKDLMFQSNPFFDPHDLAQVKYEMVRQVTHDGRSISDAAEAFGLSRPTFYQTKSALEREGISGLASKKTGPKNRHKLSVEILGFIEAQLAFDDTTSFEDLAKLVLDRFSVRVHARSISRALAESKKKKTLK